LGGAIAALLRLSELESVPTAAAGLERRKQKEAVVAVSSIDLLTGRDGPFGSGTCATKLIGKLLKKLWYCQPAAGWLAWRVVGLALQQVRFLAYIFGGKSFILMAHWSVGTSTLRFPALDCINSLECGEI